MVVRRLLAEGAAGAGAAGVAAAAVAPGHEDGTVMLKCRER